MNFEISDGAQVQVIIGKAPLLALPDGTEAERPKSSLGRPILMAAIAVLLLGGAFTGGRLLGAHGAHTGVASATGAVPHPLRRRSGRACRTTPSLIDGRQRGWAGARGVPARTSAAADRSAAARPAGGPSAHSRKERLRPGELTGGCRAQIVRPQEQFGTGAQSLRDMPTVRRRACPKGCAARHPGWFLRSVPEWRSSNLLPSMWQCRSPRSTRFGC